MDVGQGLALAGSHIADAMEDYHKEHVKYDQQLKIAQALTDIGYTPDGQLTSIAAAQQRGQKAKPAVDPKLIDMFTAKTASQRDKNLGGLEVLNKMGVATIAAGMKGAQEVSEPLYQARVQATRSLAAQRQAKGTGSGKKGNPDLDFTHAVNAHKAQVSQIEKYFNNTFGVQPQSVLDSGKQQGFVWDKDQKRYVNATGERTKNPDLVQVPTGKTYDIEDKKGKPSSYQATTWLTNDQLKALRPQAETWKQLQENPPKREAYQRQAEEAPASDTSNAVAQANQIKALYQAGKLSPTDAIAQIKALNIPTLQPKVQ